MDLSIFGTDKEREESGVRHEIGDGYIMVARFGNKPYQKKVRDLTRPHQAIFNAGGPEADELFEKATTQAMAEHILVGWGNIKDGSNDIPYTSENSYKMLMKYPDFRELVANLSQQAQNYRSAVRSAAIKNSEGL